MHILIVNLFAVENIGPIGNAVIEFGDKVVIVGSNSSGKTILSTAFYIMLTLGRAVIAPTMKLGSELTDEIRRLEEKGEIRMDLEIDAAKLINDNKQAIEESLRNYIASVFGVNSVGELIRFGNGAGRIKLNGVSLYLDGDHVSMTVDNKSLKVLIPLEFIKVKDMPGCTSSYTNGKIVAVGRDTNCLGGLIAAIAVSNAVNAPEGWRNTAFISTERVAMGSLLPTISDLFVPPRAPRVLKPLALDYLRYIMPIKYKVEAIQGENIRDLQIEINYSSATMLKAYLMGREVSPAMISTGVYQAAVIDAVSKNPAIDSMIVEEPEINLHIDMQLQIANYLAKLSKRLLITTHSEWIAMAMAHLLKRELKIYEIYNGELREVNINEDGTIAQLKTVAPHERKFIEETLGD
ncbi:hypothetical protein GCM10007981_00520 [Thermocladium modestius]|uniref:Endonuclease GajA/Old nuclease/RecF-like AAA domain-containing protein n=1 Tax=Thermocladium modestius TaxID=62609 RepID=A0A830GQP4_9CREN|nr:hypothetical protein GCM10007981_00520 [Thermocladium modestius]